MSKQSSRSSALLLTDDPESINARLTEIEKELSLLEKQREGATVLKDLYQGQPELADEKTKSQAIQQVIELTDKLQVLNIERDELRTKLTTLQNDDKSSSLIKLNRTITQSSVIWNETDDNAQSPLPGAPNSYLTAINISDNSNLEKPTMTCKARVLFDFDAHNPEEELGVKAGEVITIIKKEGEWWQAENDKGLFGYVPYNYVRLLED